MNADPTPSQEAPFTTGRFTVGSRKGYNADHIYHDDGDNPMYDSTICQVYGISMHTTLSEAKARNEKGLPNAELICAALNSATALHAAGYDAQKCIVALPMLLRYIKNKRSFGGLKTEDLLAQLRRGKGSS